MALSPIFQARGDSGQAANDAVNVQNTNTTPITAIQFTDDDPNSAAVGDLKLDFIDSNPDPAIITPALDPDTWVVINGVSYRFALVKTGTFPVASVPTALQGDIVYVIQVDEDGDGIIENSDQRYFFTTSPDGTVANMAQIGTGALTLGNVDETPCFCNGTEIATPSGPRRVETLVAGDWVTTATGEVRQVIWVGASSVTRATLAFHPNLRPVVIPAHAFGPGSPSADLRVSPQHRVLISHPACELLFGETHVLVSAKFLVGTLAEISEPTADVDYIHILLADHDMLLSNGLATESFQPARRMMDVMASPARQILEDVIAALGEDNLLTRKDSYLSLRQPEAKVLLQAMAQPQALAASAATDLSLAH